MRRIALCGYGRFGAALAGCLRDAGCSLRALDPQAPVPTQLRAEDPRQLLEDAEGVVIAVPVTEVERTLRQLRPHLRPEQLVWDVASVKCGPVAAMERVLGQEIPWVGTHPLFGPVSLARCERPLRAVVCPNPTHPQAATRAAALYRRLGCEVIFQDAAEHDSGMAESHAVAYFLAKGILDAGLQVESPYAPPSAQAIARTVEAVREDAGHLFVSLHRENPFAAEVRQRLLEALGSVHSILLAPPAPASDHKATARLRIADLGARSPALEEARSLIDEIDDELLGLLARRMQIALRAGRAKAALGVGIKDPEREATLLEQRRRSAERHRLPAGGVEQVFQSILQLSRLHQARDALQEPPIGSEP